MSAVRAGSPHDLHSTLGRAWLPDIRSGACFTVMPDGHSSTGKVCSTHTVSIGMPVQFPPAAMVSQFWIGTSGHVWHSAPVVLEVVVTDEVVVTVELEVAVLELAVIELAVIEVVVIEIVVV